MERDTPELSRRQLLAAIAMTSLAAHAKGSGVNKSKRAAHLGSHRRSLVVRFDAQVSRDGQRSVTVPISVDIAKTVVIVCDMQNYFGAKGGMFDRAGVDISMIQQAVGPTAKVLASARRTGVQIVYLKMGFRPDLSDLGASDSVNRVRHLEGFKVGQMTAPSDRSEPVVRNHSIRVNFDRALGHCPSAAAGLVRAV